MIRRGSEFSGHAFRAAATKPTQGEHIRLHPGEICAGARRFGFVMPSLHSTSPRLLVLIPLAAALVGCGKDAAAASQTATPPPTEVAIVTIRTEPLTVDDELPGRVAAFRVAEVRPQVGGIVRSRKFEGGETVRAGQSLFQIESSPYRAEVAGASAALERSRAALALAELESERNSRLFESGSTSRRTLDGAEATRALAAAEVAQATAALQRSRINLRFANVTAPIEGQIGVARVTEGALVTPADPSPLAVIQQIDQVYVDVRQPAHRFDELREAARRGDLVGGESTEVTVLSSTGEPYDLQGRLLFSDITVDPGTSEVTLRALVPNEGGRLLPGMFVRVRVARGTDPQAIVIPQQAVQRGPGGDEQVVVVGADGKAALRTIVTGRVVQGRYVVRSGLEAGDRVVVEGQDRVRPGDPVRTVDWQPPTAAAAH